MSFPVIVSPLLATRPFALSLADLTAVADALVVEEVVVTESVSEAPGGIVGFPVRSAYDPVVATVASVGAPDNAEYEPLNSVGSPESEEYAPLNRVGLPVRSAYEPVVATVASVGAPVNAE